MNKYYNFFLLFFSFEIKLFKHTQGINIIVQEIVRFYGKYLLAKWKMLLVDADNENDWDLLYCITFNFWLSSDLTLIEIK